MTVGTLALTCVLLVAGQAPDDIMSLNKRRVRIPIDIQPSRLQEITQLTLYVSPDKGQTWHKEAVVPPEKGEFIFNAPADGEYWFRMATTNRQDKQEPENIYNGPPPQKILIDTLQPLVRITSAQRQGEEAAVAWEIQEDHPDLASLRLEYRTADMPEGSWERAMVSPSLTGQTRIRLPGPKAVQLRLQMKDTAGNLSVTEATVAGAAGVTTAGFTPESQAPPAPSHADPAVPSPGSVKAPPAAQSESSSRDTNFVPPPSLPQAQAERVPSPAGGIAGNVGSPSAVQRPENRGDVGAQLVASSEVRVPTAGPAAPSAPPAAPTRALPPLQIVNNTELTMEYELTRVGPSGVGKVELWLTEDDGKSWQRWAEDPEATASLRGGKYQRRVELPREGVFGFRLVVQSPVGLGDAPPHAGDPPEMRVEVDITPPRAQLYCGPDPQHDNALLLKWECEDRNLSATPVTLEWAERAEGPWHPIAPPLAASPNWNSWKLPSGIPVYVYLRLRVRDKAGNEGVAVTPRPQLADLSKPAGHLLSISPTPPHP
jgi:hypothetical protein